MQDNHTGSGNSNISNGMFQAAAHYVQEKAVRDLILEENHRVDGRKLGVLDV